jgi:polysaccharide export outer membrane protein
MASPLRLFTTCFALGALLLLAGCETSRMPVENPRVPELVSTSLLRQGDSLSVALLGVPDASTNPVQIDEQGAINLPFIGTVPAANSTTAELQQRIRQTYLDRKIYTAVEVSVAVTERFVYVGGEVSHPGRIVWTPDLTLSKAIQAAGGFTLYAKEKRVRLVRDKSSYEIDVNLAQRDPAQDPKLVPGDSLQVSRSPF